MILTMLSPHLPLLHPHPPRSPFRFNSTGPGNILTVADDLLKNDGQKFLEMMEQLAERRMQREEEAVADLEDDSDLDSDDELDGDEDDVDEDDDGGYRNGNDGRQRRSRNRYKEQGEEEDSEEDEEGDSEDEEEEDEEDDDEEEEVCVGVFGFCGFLFFLWYPWFIMFLGGFLRAEFPFTLSVVLDLNLSISRSLIHLSFFYFPSSFYLPLITRSPIQVMTEAQKMEEGKRMFSIFAARMFEQRVLTAYREKVIVYYIFRCFDVEF